MEPKVQALLPSFRKLLAEHPELDAEFIESTILPSVGLTAHRVPQDQLALGASRLGGIPDVPPDFEWPRWLAPPTWWDKLRARWQPRTPTPLGFLAQVNLSEMPCIDPAMPLTGWLYFFYDFYRCPWGFDPTDREAFRVFYIDCLVSRLKRAMMPADSNRKHVDHACRVEAQAMLTLPDALPDEVADDDQFGAYDELRERLPDADGHRLLGHPQIVQGPMELECQLASNGLYCGTAAGYDDPRAKALEAGAVDWRLLLQIDTDEDGPGWMWGDLGKIYFWIKKQDLAARRFDGVWLILQCT